MRGFSGVPSTMLPSFLASVNKYQSNNKTTFIHCAQSIQLLLESDDGKDVKNKAI